MTTQHEQEWAEAQKITVSVDLVEASKKQLQFLAAVDRNRFLFDDHSLERAIYRYNAYWLPLLAKHVKNTVSANALVVPLDCEWIWHCHRLNPVRYMVDCNKLFGRMLTNNNVISSVNTSSKSTTEAIWKKLYPDEPYELDYTKPFSGDVLRNSSLTEKFTDYDLLAAVKRQASFLRQVSVRPYMSDDLFLQEALLRYKGFLHLIRTNRKQKLNRFCVPSYDIDLMWHTHQLYPDSYCRDMRELVGSVVQHDDTVADRSKGSKIDIGHSSTTTQWEEAFGSSYWKAGTLYGGNLPAPVTQVPCEFNSNVKEFNSSEKCSQPLEFPVMEAVEVLLEFVDIKNLPEEHKENLVVVFSKKDSDKFCNTRRSLRVSSICNEKQVANFQCESKGEFHFELMSRSSSNEINSKSFKRLGSCSFSLEQMVSSQSPLSANEWISVNLVSDLGNLERVFLCVSISCTPPISTPREFKLERSQPVKHVKSHATVMDDEKNKAFSLQIRNIAKDSIKQTPTLGKAMYVITNSGKEDTLVEFHEKYWLIKGTHGSFKFQSNSGTDDSLFELVGHKMVKFFLGRRLVFDPKRVEKETLEENFMTAVEFSPEHPYGRAVALLDIKSETIKVIDEWMVLPGVALTFILSDIMGGARKGIDFAKQGRNEKINITSESENKVNCVTECAQNFALKGLVAGECLDLVICEGGCGGDEKFSMMTSSLKFEVEGGECLDLVICEGGCGGDEKLSMKSSALKLNVEGGECLDLVICEGGCGSDEKLPMETSAQKLDVEGGECLDLVICEGGCGGDEKLPMETSTFKLEVEGGECLDLLICEGGCGGDEKLSMKTSPIKLEVEGGECLDLVICEGGCGSDEKLPVEMSILKLDVEGGECLDLVICEGGCGGQEQLQMEISALKFDVEGGECLDLVICEGGCGGDEKLSMETSPTLKSNGYFGASVMA